MISPMDVDSDYNDDADEGVDEVDDMEAYKHDKNPFITYKNPFQPPRYENKGGAFTTGINIFSRKEQQKMEERAKRFGLKSAPKTLTIEDEEQLYSSMGVYDDSENTKYIRLNVLHMRGTDEMSTQDVFDYFKDYAPASIEWINDMSCNVVWLDKISTARALLGLSKRITGITEKSDSTKQSQLDEVNSLADESRENEEEVEAIENNSNKNGKNDHDNTIDFKAINFPLPPGIWRKGIDCSKSKKILLRFATISDKKQPNSEKLSEYYKKYGNPNFGGMKGFLTDSRKRLYRDIKTKRKAPNGTADGETINAKNPWGSLSETWGAHDPLESDIRDSSRREILPDNRRAGTERGGIKERLGFKPQSKEIMVENDVEESESNSDSDDDWNKRSKVLRMRMHADDEEEKLQKKKLKQLTRRMQERMMSGVGGGGVGGGRDLRSRLGRVNSLIYREPIKVTVTNIPERLREPVRINHEYVMGEVGVQDVEDDDDDEEEVEEIQDVQEVVHDHDNDDDDDDEKEEGECEEDNENEADIQRTFDQDEEEEEEESDSDSDISEKEVQGPKGSVIKVVPRPKPRIASTVWPRNHNAEKSSSQERKDLRSTLNRDLRSRLGYHKRERSPLRIEVKNDKYTKRHSESE